MKRLLKAPSLSITDEELSRLPYPVYGSPKLDGFRCCIVKGIARTNSMKMINNQHTFETLSTMKLDGFDGELIVGPTNTPDAFHNSSGPLRRKAGTPDFKFYVFDRAAPGTYAERWLNRNNGIPHYLPVVKIQQSLLKSPQDVIDFTQLCIDNNYEGAMIRTATGLYKEGRATFNEMNIFKRKWLEDAEATIVGFVEKLTNTNKKFTNEQGLTSRSTAKSGKVPAGTLGSFILQSDAWAEPFNCGGGCLDHARRQAIWNVRETFLGRKVTYRYQAYGSIDAPRQPVFRRFYEEI